MQISPGVVGFAPQAVVAQSTGSGGQGRWTQPHWPVLERRHLPTLPPTEPSAQTSVGLRGSGPHSALEQGAGQAIAGHAPPAGAQMPQLWLQQTSAAAQVLAPQVVGGVVQPVTAQ